jgi:hypothetical protein
MAAKALDGLAKSGKAPDTGSAWREYSDRRRHGLVRLFH